MASEVYIILINFHNPNLAYFLFFVLFRLKTFVGLTI